MNPRRLTVPRNPFMGSNQKPREMGQTQTRAGQLEYREPVTEEWNHARDSGQDPTDKTTFLLQDKTWGIHRANRPPLLFQIDSSGAFRGQKATGYLMDRGRIVLDAFDHGIRQFVELPKAMTSAVSGQDMMWYFRQNKFITMYDLICNYDPSVTYFKANKYITARMPNGYHDKENGGLWRDGPPRSGTLSMRATRFRLQAGIISWTNREGSATKNRKILAIIPQSCQHPTINSTQSFRDLSASEQKSVESAGSMPQRARLANREKNAEGGEKSKKKSDRKNGRGRKPMDEEDEEEERESDSDSEEEGHNGYDSSEEDPPTEAEDSEAEDSDRHLSRRRSEPMPRKITSARGRKHSRGQNLDESDIDNIAQSSKHQRRPPATEEIPTVPRDLQILHELGEDSAPAEARAALLASVSARTRGGIGASSSLAFSNTAENEGTLLNDGMDTVDDDDILPNAEVVPEDGRQDPLGLDYIHDDDENEESTSTMQQSAQQSSTSSSSRQVDQANGVAKNSLRTSTKPDQRKTAVKTTLEFATDGVTQDLVTEARANSKPKDYRYIPPTPKNGATAKDTEAIQTALELSRAHFYQQTGVAPPFTFNEDHCHESYANQHLRLQEVYHSAWNRSRRGPELYWLPAWFGGWGNWKIVEENGRELWALALEADKEGELQGQEWDHFL